MAGTVALKCLPYALVVGFEKCGTTELHNKLALHPQVVAPYRKEPFYWGENGKRREREGGGEGEREGEEGERGRETQMESEWQARGEGGRVERMMVMERREEMVTERERADGEGEREGKRGVRVRGRDGDSYR